MASLTEHVAQETWELMFRMLGISTGLVADSIAAGGETAELLKKGLEAVIEDIRKKNEENKETAPNEDGTVSLESLVRKMNREKAGILSLPVPDEDVSLIKEKFKQQGLTFTVFDVGYDDIQLFLFADNENRKAERGIMQAQAERGLISDLNPDLFFENVGSKDIGTVSGLSNVELELFRYHAKRNGLLFTSVAENGTNTVVYDLATASKAKKTISDVVWDFSGDDGELIRKQIEFKISSRQAVNLAFLDGEREYYIVNGNHPENYIFITANDFEYYKNSKMIFDVPRSYPGFMDRAIQAVNSYDNPVLLTKQDFEKCSSKEQLEQLVKTALKNEVNNDALHEALDRQMQKRILLEEKMELDNENQGQFWLFDDSISYSEGAAHESLNDLDAEQKESIQKAKTVAQKFSFNQYQADDKNLEHLIEVAEAQRDRGYRYADEPERVV